MVELVTKAAVESLLGNTSTEWELYNKIEALPPYQRTMPPAQPEPSDIARDIATILENQKDMKVILKNGERKKGKWTRPSRRKTYERICSVCGKKAWYCGTGDYDYCPWCGADMRGEEE